MKEIWKDIKGYKGLYQASSQGRFKSLRLGKIITPTIYNGRNVLGLINRKGINKSFVASRIIAELFIPNPNNFGMVKCRGDRKDLRPSNWFWKSYSEDIKDNAKYRKHIVRRLVCENRDCGKTFIIRKSNKKVMYCSKKCSDKTYWSRLGKKGRMKHVDRTKKKVVAMKDGKAKKFNSIDEAATYLKIDPSGISNMLAGRQKTCSGHKFKLL